MLHAESGADQGTGTELLKLGRDAGCGEGGNMIFFDDRAPVRGRGGEHV